MIDTVRLKNYRGHTDTEIAFGRLTVLVGENATGKTSVLEAVHWVSSGLQDTLPADLLRRGTTELELVLTGTGREGPVRIEAVYARQGQQSELQQMRASVLNEDGSIDELRQTRASVLNEDGSTGTRPQAEVLSLNAEDLAAPSPPKHLIPRLTSTGRGLASVLAYLKLAETERFERIVERLRAVVPLVRGIGFTRVEVSATVPRLIRVEDRHVELAETVTTINDALLFDFADATKVPAPLVSEGTLITLGILTILEQLHRERDRRPGEPHHWSEVDIVLIDDIDRALHPRAQRKLIETLRAALEATPGLQILATSHSPYLIDALRPEEIVVLGRNREHVIVAKRLDAFPDERLRTMLSTGELWMSEGEEWVTK